MKLSQRAAIITGASEGLGFAIAKAFLEEGARVAICARNAGRLEQARLQLSALAASDAHLLALPCDVASETGVAQMVERALDTFGSVQVLINNAGVLGPIGKTEEVNLEEWRRTFDTNVLGVLHTCRLLVPHFRTASYGKIINLSGGGATSPRPFFSAYAASKAAVVRLTENLAVELEGSGIDVNAVAPGALNTQMLEQTLAAGSENIGASQLEQAERQKQTGGSSIEKAASLVVYLASRDSDGITGRLISAPWDPWATLHERGEELRSSDVYTLRRIVPEDRAKRWN